MEQVAGVTAENTTTTTKTHSEPQGWREGRPTHGSWQGSFSPTGPPAACPSCELAASTHALCRRCPSQATLAGPQELGAP